MVELLPPPRSAEQWRNTPGLAFLGPLADRLPRIAQRMKWLRGDDALSRLPFHVACHLAGHTYRNFDSLRVAFWKLVAADPFVQGIYTCEARRQRGVKEGIAPRAPESQQIVRVRRIVAGGGIKAALPGSTPGSVGGLMLDSEVDPDSLRSYVLHHLQPIHTGGAVYNLSNLVVVTPLVHDALLSRDYHYGQPEWLRKKIEAYYANKD